MSEQSPPMGDNAPPLADRLVIDYQVDTDEALAVARRELADITDNATLGDAAQLVRDARAMVKAMDAKRADEKAPFDRDGKIVQAYFSPTLTALGEAQKRAERAIGRWNQQVEDREREARALAARLEREASDKRMALAAEMESRGHGGVGEAVMAEAQKSEDFANRLDAQATGKASDLVRTATSGGTVSSSSRPDFEIADITALRATLGMLGSYLDRPSIERAVRAYLVACTKAESTPVLDGVRFFNSSRAVVR